MTKSTRARHTLEFCNDPLKSCSGVTFQKETPMSEMIEEEIKRWPEQDLSGSLQVGRRWEQPFRVNAATAIR